MQSKNDWHSSDVKGKAHQHRAGTTLQHYSLQLTSSIERLICAIVGALFFQGSIRARIHHSDEQEARKRSVVAEELLGC